MKAVIPQSALHQIVTAIGQENVLSHASELTVYECDGLTFHRHLPDLVAFPRSTEDVQKVVAIACEHHIPLVARGAGTSLSGGTIPVAGGIIIETSRLNRILEINPVQRYAVVEPGVVNLDLSAAARPFDLYFAPDPSSQSSCTIGGNIGTNAGGPHCLKYGSTALHVLGLEMVTVQGQVVQTGSPQGTHAGLDLTGLFTGSEGILGIVTRAWVKLTPLPERVETFLTDFLKLRQASDAVSEIIAAGIVPAAMEMLDQLCIQAVENSIFAAGYPSDAAAVLLVEIDGLEIETEVQGEQVRDILTRCGARQVREARDDEERNRLWAGRKKAFGAFGRLAQNLYLQDTVVPRTRLTEVLERVYAIAAHYELPVVNVFHAGDGNLHPVLLYNSEDPQETQRVLEASREMIEVAVRAGGTITGEHGVGLEKRDFMTTIFSEEDLEIMGRIRSLFDPEGLCNPQKVLPMGKVCMEFQDAVKPAPAV